MPHRGYHLLAFAAAAVAFAALGMWLFTVALIALVATLSARDLLDDELCAQRMAIVASTIPPDRGMDRVRLEQLVDEELRVLAGIHSGVVTVVEAACASATDRWHHALIGDRLTRAVTGPAAPEARVANRWILPACVSVLITAAAVRHPLVMFVAYGAAAALLFVRSLPHIRTSVTAVHAAEVAVLIGAEIDQDHIEAFVQIRLRHISQGRTRPTRRSLRYTDEPLAHRRLRATAAR